MDRQLHLSIAKELVEVVSPVSNPTSNDFIVHKPAWGLWTSTYDVDNNSSAWIEYRESTLFGGVPLTEFTWWLLTPRQDARIYTIDSREKVSYLHKHYPLRLRRSQNNTRTIDFEAVSKDYDGLHLSWQGYQALSQTRLVGDWSCESTIWFHWCFSEVEQIAPGIMMQEVLP